MAYDEHLAERIRRVFQDKKVKTEEKKMMGGLCFMVKDKMCSGIMKDMLMARIDPVLMKSELKRKGCHQMEMGGRTMKGFIFVDPIGTDLDDDLEHWLQLCIDFNPKAKASKKKGK